MAKVAIKRLNLGDCFSYALAKATGEPLIQRRYFSRTDIPQLYVFDILPLPFLKEGASYESS